MSSEAIVTDFVPGEEEPPFDAVTPEPDAGSEAAAPPIAGIPPRPATRPLDPARPATRLGWIRAVAMVVLFVAGIVGGGLAYGALNPAPPPMPWPSVPSTPEPAAAHQIATALAGNDARTVASALDPDTLTALGTALDPVVEITDVRFLGAVGSGGEQFAAYLVHGRDSQGTDQIVGFVLHVKDSKVVGVNA